MGVTGGVVVIGGGYGLGKEVALSFARNGASVLAVARTESKLRATATEAQQYPGRLEILVADGTEEKDVARIRAVALEKLPSVDVVVNCVGTSYIRDRITDVTLEDFERVVKGNLTSVFLSMREFLPAMLEAKKGVLINISSRTALGPTIRPSVYAAAKAGVVTLSLAWAAEAKKHGVRVLIFTPAPLDTPMRWAANPDFKKERTLPPKTLADYIVWVTEHPELTFEGVITPMSTHY